MEILKYIKPSVILAPFVKHYWTLKIESDESITQRIFSTGSVQLIFHKAGRMMSTFDKGVQPRSFIGGQMIGFSDLSTTKKVDMIVVVFYPYGAKSFFNIPMDKFYGTNVSVDDIGDASLKELEDKIQEIEDDSGCIKLIEDYLINRLNNFKEYNSIRIKSAVKLAEIKSDINITDLAENTYLSEKQFNRIFSEEVGLNPKKFLRILRFHRALYILQNNNKINLTQLALDCGYYDQSHLIKEFKTFSGYTPTEYMAICEPFSDYFNDF